MGALHNISDSSGRQNQSAVQSTPLLKPISEFEISILAALWNHRPRSLGIAYVCLYANPLPGAMMAPYAIALNSLIERGLVLEIVAPSFEYRLSRDGYWAIISLVAAGRGEKFEACLSGNALPAVQCEKGADFGQTSAPEIRVTPSRLCIVKTSEEVHLDFCWTECGRIAPEKCDCGNPVCSAHRYNANGDHDPKGGCSACSLEASRESMDAGTERFNNITGRA